MVLKIKKNSKKEDIEKKIKKMDMKPTGLQSFVGALKRNIDGLSYQKKIRDEWN
jgi:hypothetical protein